MVKWSFEVRHGDLSILPSALVAQAEEQRKLNVGCFLISEAGTLLNEPDKQMVHSIPKQGHSNRSDRRRQQESGVVI